MDYPSHLENAWEEEETMPMYRQQRNGWSIVMCQKHCKRETRWSEKNYINNTIQNSLEENITKPFLKYTKAKKKKKKKKKRQHWSVCVKCGTRWAEKNYINNTIQDSLEENNTKPFLKYFKARKQDNTGALPLKGGGWLNSGGAISDKSNNFAQLSPSSLSLVLAPIPAQSLSKIVYLAN